MIAIVGSAAVLPHYGVIHRLLRVAVPNYGGFALVGDTDRLYILSVDIYGGDRLRDYRRLRRPDLMRVMFHPSRTREDLWKLLLSHGAYAAVVIKHDGAGTARSLIQRQDIFLCIHICYQF